MPPRGEVGGDPKYGYQLRSSYESHMPSFNTLSQVKAEIPIPLYSTVAGYTPLAPPGGAGGVISIHQFEGHMGRVHTKNFSPLGGNLSKLHNFAVT